MKNKSRGFVNPFIVMDVMNKAKKAEENGKSVIHMEVGQPQTCPPRKALEKLTNDILSSNLGYTSSLGIPSLKIELSNFYKKNYGLFIDPERFLITSGSSSAFILAFTSLFEINEKILIGVPGYPSYKNIVKSLSLNPKIIQTKKSNNFQLSEEDILNSDADGVILASPCNPTGSVLEKSELKVLINAAEKSNIKIVSDEIYHGWYYENKVHSSIEISDEAYVIGSFSKYFSMTGWRVGWMIVPNKDIRRIERLSQNLFICAPHSGQLLAKYSIQNEKELKINTETYAKNRDILLKALPEIGFEILSKPKGAFYIYCSIKNLSNNSKTFCDEIFNKTGVAITPGIDFDAKRGLKTVRFSYCLNQKEVEEAIKRLKKELIK